MEPIIVVVVVLDRYFVQRNFLAAKRPTMHGQFNSARSVDTMSLLPLLLLMQMSGVRVTATAADAVFAQQALTRGLFELEQIDQRSRRSELEARYLEQLSAWGSTPAGRLLTHPATGDDSALDWLD